MQKIQLCFDDLGKIDFRAFSFCGDFISNLCSGVACGDFALLYPNDNLAVIGIPLDCHNGETRIKGGGVE